MTGLSRDVRYALRTLAKSSGFTTVAILTLALGIGATTTVFSVVDGVLLNPFPYKSAERLATPWIQLPNQINLRRFPVPVFLDFKERNHTFQDMIGLAYLGIRYSVGGVTEQVWGGWVTPDSFEVLGSKPFLGRPMTPDDGNPGSPPVFIMSHRLWVAQFNSDPKILGTTLNLNGTPRTLIAVMPPRFRFGECEIWIPLSLTRDTFIPGFGLAANELWTVGHLKPGVSTQQAGADLEVIAKQLEKSYPTYFRPQFKIGVISLLDYFVGDFKLAIVALMAAVAMLLLIACSNVANLLLARASVREKEIAIRAALGATHGRLVRQLLVESFLLAMASCCVGCIFAYLGLKVAIAVIPQGSIPSEATIALRPATLLFAIGVAVLTTVICGLAPAIHAVRRDLRAGLAGAGTGASGSFRHGRLRSCLVIAEVAVSMVLLIGTGLMVRTFLALERVDIGFNPANVLYADLGLPEGQYDTAVQKQIFFRKVIERVKAIPGVSAATVASSVPPYSWGWTEVVVPGKTHSEPWGATLEMCSEDYFKTLDRHLLRGRLLSESDVDTARHVTVINETLARAYFQNEDAIGKRIKFSSFEMYSDWPRDAYFEIIGIIADAKNQGLQDPPRPEVYFPHTLTGVGGRHLLIRIDSNPKRVLASLGREISALDAGVAVLEIGSVQNFLKHEFFTEPQFSLIMLGTFAGIGLLLVVVGIFSVMAYTVSLQTREIGIRMALGAQRNDVLRMILKKGLVLIAGGVLAGVVLQLSMTRFMANRIWGVSATDPWTYLGVVVVILAVGAAACLLPACRAARVDPLAALRSE